MPTRLVDLEAQAERLEQQERKRNREFYSKPLPTNRWTNDYDKKTAASSAPSLKLKFDSEQNGANKRQKPQGPGNRGFQSNITCYTCHKRGILCGRVTPALTTSHPEVGRVFLMSYRV